MPGPGFPVANKILYKYEQDRAYRLHRQKVHGSRPTVNNKKPQKHPHLILQLKKIQLEEERQAEVDHENRLLLQKMTRIMKEPAKVDSWNEYQSKSLNLPLREKQLREIQMENIGLAKRLEHTRPVIRTEEMEEEYQQKKYLQMLWNENAKDFDMVIPRHQRYRQLRKIKEAELAREREEKANSGEEGKKDALPPITIRYNGPDTQRSTRSDNGDKERKSDDGSSMDRSHFSSQVDNDAKALFKVAKGLAQPDDVFIRNLVRRTQSQRTQILERFKEMYSLDLATELLSGLGKDWECLINALLKNKSVGTAKLLHDALEEGDYQTAVEILFTCKNSDLTELKDTYRKEYSQSLDMTINEKTEDPERCLLATLAKGGRDESNKVIDSAAETDAEDLYESGDGRWTSDTGKFLKLLKTRNNKHIILVLNLYKINNKGTEATDDIKRECSRTYSEALIALINCLHGPENHFADRLFRTMSPTNSEFVNLLVSRSEIDIPAVRKAYKKKYDAELMDDIRHKCQHTTTKVLLEIANKTPPDWPKTKHVDKRVRLPDVVIRRSSNDGLKTLQTTTQKKWRGANPVPQQTKPPIKRVEPSSKGAEQKHKHNPLAQSSMRIAADTSIQRREEEKHKHIEKEKRKEDERQKKNISGTIKPANNFNPSTDCERLHDALLETPLDEEDIIDVLTTRSNGQRQIMKNKWSTKYKKYTLEAKLKEKLSVDHDEVITGLMMTPSEYDAYCLKEALDGLGLSDPILVGILSTRDAKEMKEIKEIFKKEYKKDLVQELTAHVDPDLADFVVLLCQGEREQDSEVNGQTAKKDAEKMNKNGRVDVVDKPFRDVVLKKNHAQVKLTFSEFQKLTGSDIYQSIADTVVGETEDAYISLVSAIEDPVKFYAEKLFTSFGGLGTNEDNIVRIIVSRSEIDLRDIKVKFQQQNQKSLSAMLKADFPGDSKNVLLAILGDN
ncbi:annexin A6-like isoform X2 [Saccostrea echinata]|uniref:annexin A6-like isoform X2 n=1 Tax=Saccostrea echinata TaxID=191078 RepID=UPI002A81498B|nr:annexin A6-like isoform X2 [Saccostrea echinata]